MKKGSNRIVVLMVSTALVTGCVTNGVMAKYNNKNDVCYAQRQPLISIEKDFSKSIIQGALAMAAVGTGLGFLLGGKDRVIKAIIGGGIGLLTGAAAGYLKAKYDKGLSQDQILEEIDKDTSRDKNDLSRTTNVVKNLTDCRFDQLQTVRNQAVKGDLTKDQATIKLKEIKKLMNEDQELIQEILDDSSKRLDAYTAVEAQVLSIEKDRVVNKDLAPVWLEPMLGQDSQERNNIVVSRFVYSLGNTNVRSGPSMSKSVVGSLGVNEKVEVIRKVESASEWYEIRFKESTAYTHSSRFKEQEVKVAAATPKTHIKSQGLIDPSPKLSEAPLNTHEQAAFAYSEAKTVSKSRYKQLSAELDDIALIGGINELSLIRLKSLFVISS